MIIHLTEHYEKLALPGSFPPLHNDSHPLLYHQMRTIEALYQAPLVVNSYATGTGKTRASLLHLFTLNGQRHNVLFIAPTNALIRQHVEDIKRFVHEYNLSFRVIEVNAERLRTIGLSLAMPQRNGEKLHRLISNPLEFAADLGIDPRDTQPFPLIMVVNPDIFHYMLFFRYGPHDQRNLFEHALAGFGYIVVDEFHYYDYKQLVSFLAFLNFWEEWGYFAEGRRVCLLSATPNAQIETYLSRLLGDHWQHISPDNEPPESANHPKIQTLSALNLEISDTALREWVITQHTRLISWLTEGLDGAIISNSLARINVVYDQLANLDVCRVTGPEPPERREQALRHKLILATPVVDIGYNFDRQKKRQNIDFVILEGRYSDDIVQRIGRAGRVLGKLEQHHLSQAVALVNEEVARSLRAYDGATLDRRAFRELLGTIPELPPKHQLEDYIRVHGITEAFYPLYKAGAMLLPDEKDVEVDALYERIRSVFAPQSQTRTKALTGFFAAFNAREQWVNANHTERWSVDGWHGKTLVANMASWITQLQMTSGKRPVVNLEQARSVLSDRRKRAGLEEFITSQYYLTRSLFAFRDSFNGPEVVLYDPHRLFSSQEHSCYDLLHLVANYHLHLFTSRDEYVKICGEPGMKGDLYVRLQSRRETTLQIEFRLEREDTTQQQFENRFCRCPVALNRLRLVARVRHGDLHPLQEEFTEAIREIYIPLLILPNQDEGALRATLRGTPIIARRLSVVFEDANIGEYQIVVGSATWHADAALRRHFKFRERQEACEAIIL